VASRRARIGGLDVAGLERFVGDLGAAWESMLEALEEQASGALVKATATRDRALRERDVAIERVTQAQARVKELGPVAAPVGEAAALERELRTVATRLAEAEQSLAALSGDDTATIEAQRRAVEVAAAALARAKDDVQVASDTLERNARELQRKLGERDAQRARVEQDRPALAARVTALEGELAAQAVALITQAQVEDAERVLQAARARFDQANEAFHVANGALTRLGGPALREQQHQVLEALKVARTRERALEVDAEAWRLLHETLREAENTAGSHLGRALAAPVEARFVELTRGRYRSLGLGPSLTATTLEVRGVAGHGAEVLDALSVGTRDQLATLVRLAIAAQLHSAIVLDDHLVHTDLTRLDWFNGVLREVATDAQVLVFTCRPHDYLAKAELPTKGAATRDAAGGAVRSVDLEAVVETWPARNKATKAPKSP
jgi:DNA repair exonuclease SbcCD ATPase subunit